VKVDGDSIDIGNGKIKVTAVRDPATLPWKDLGIDIALECTGIFSAKARRAPDRRRQARAGLGAVGRR
jgi:glyceraldehyde 3-phosphate dehydrogenase